MGVGAAIAAPEWFVPFMRENPIIGQNLLSLVTTVPAAAIGAIVMGFGLARVLKGQYFLFGLLAVCVMVVLHTLVVDFGRGFLGGLRMHALPHYLAIPMFFAQWLFLPLATLFFGRRKDHGGNQAAFS